MLQTPAQYQSGREADLGDLSHVLGLLIALVALTRQQTGVATVELSPSPLTAAVAVSCAAALLAGPVPARQAGRVVALLS